MLHLIWFNWVAWQDKLPDQILRMGFLIKYSAVSWESSLMKQGTFGEEKNYWLFSYKKLRKYQLKMSPKYLDRNSNVKVKGHTGLSKTSFWNMWKEKHWYHNFECHTCSDRSYHLNLTYINISYQLVSL